MGKETMGELLQKAREAKGLSQAQLAEVSGVPIEASWMSPVVLPSPLPGASSGSLLVAEARNTPAAGSQKSLTCQAACTGTIRWFGDHSVVGLSFRIRDGGVVSTTDTVACAAALAPRESVT